MSSQVFVHDFLQEQQHNRDALGCLGFLLASVMNHIASLVLKFIFFCGIIYLFPPISQSLQNGADNTKMAALINSSVCAKMSISGCKCIWSDLF